MTEPSLTQRLARFLTEVHFESLPDAVIQRTEALCLDWFASALAGRGAQPVQSLMSFAQTMGPRHGPSQVLPSRTDTTPYFAALVNAAASHVVEQDDLHNASVLHPGTVVFPAILAVGQSTHASGRALITAAVAGYEAGVRVGEYLGLSHYTVFHTTGTAGTLAAAAGVAHLLQLPEAAFTHALGCAGTQAAGLWEFLRDGADSKQLHTAKAAADGLLSAYVARDNMTGAQRILEGDQGLAAGMLGAGDSARMLDGWGERWAVTETSFKYHASCRHTHPAADALLKIVVDNNLVARDIKRIRAHVYRAALDVLGPVTDPSTVHQSKFSMGFVLALIAARRRAGIAEFTDEALGNPELRRLGEKVEMILDAEIDAMYPQRWSSRVEVDIADGRTLNTTINVPKGDPENPLSRDELEDKARALAAYAGGASRDEVDRIIHNVFSLHEVDDINHALRLDAIETCVTTPRALEA
ncbi:MAG: MmgE/PrpD family protein [Gammaproteobacteria bacterium]|nr:MmgE/PrpD family protein [Gammaproteobacteria bacterium]